MAIRDCTLPEAEPALRRFQAEQANGFPLLPFSPEPGDLDAGWLAGPAGSPEAYAWLRRQTGGRGLLEMHTPDKVYDEIWETVHARARAWELTRVVTRTPESDRAAHARLEQLGFSPFGQVLPMSAPAPTARPLPEPPSGQYLRPFKEFGHLPTLAALLHRAYHDLPSRPEYETDGVTVETVRTEIRSAPAGEVEKDYFLLLNDFGKGVGVVRCRRGGWIDGPGVVPELRDRDLHRVLLEAAVHRMAETDAAALRLVVYEPLEHQVADYRAAGFQKEIPLVCFQLELS